MDPQTITTQNSSSQKQNSVLGNLSLSDKANLLKKVKKYTNENYEGIINEEDLAIAEKALEEYMKKA